MTPTDLVLQADAAYQTQILASVSRTFALTIPQLPPALCQVVGNGYLLCRIADTIEDDPALSLAQKQLFSEQFIEVVAGQYDAQQFSDALAPLLSDAMLAAEKELIANTPSVIRLTHSFTETQQAALSRCVKIMALGMAEFQRNSSLAGLPDLAALDRYCYYVAGVVGEMLTDLFCDYSLEIAEHTSALQRLSVEFGQALQMTNILKDIWDDQQRGMCWLPQDVFSDYGFDLGTLTPHTHQPAFGQGLTALIAIALAHAQHALQYVLLIPKHEQGIRRFCLWALGMAVLTLRNIYYRLDFTDGQQVKISRRSVKATIWVSNLANYHNSSLRALFYLLTRDLPKIKGTAAHPSLETMK